MHPKMGKIVIEKYFQWKLQRRQNGTGHHRKITDCFLIGLALDEGTH